MFNKKLKKEIERKIESLHELERGNNRRKISKDDIETCDKCKCLIYKSDAIKGESRIFEAYSPYPEIGVEEKIVTPLYCHRCQPIISLVKKTKTKKK